LLSFAANAVRKLANQVDLPGKIRLAEKAETEKLFNRE
jgi:hypothetical protein